MNEQYLNIYQSVQNTFISEQLLLEELWTVFF